MASKTVDHLQIVRKPRPTYREEEPEKLMPNAN
jgi:hypothetical protein